MDTASWKERSQFTGSLPVWSADGSAIAVLRDPADLLMPGTANTIAIIDPRSGGLQSATSLLVRSVGWSGGTLYGIAGGRVVPIADPTHPVIECSASCRSATWSVGTLVVLDRIDAAELELHDLARTPTFVQALGSARDLAWAASAPALAWATSDGVHSWQPGRGIDSIALPRGTRPKVWSPGGEILVCVQPDGSWAQWRAADQTISGVDIGTDVDLNSPMLWSPDGRQVAVVPAAFSAVRVGIRPVTAEYA
jgi:hypothetical protein